MKTSNILIASVLLILLIALVGYDFALKAEYETGNYKNPYRNFVTLKFSGFNSADLISATTANVKFVQGPFKVMVDSMAMEYVDIKQRGGRLQITAAYEHDYRYNPNPYVVIISCPLLSSINASAVYRANHKQVIDTLHRDDWNMRGILVEGFKLDSLAITQDYGSEVILSNNTITSLHAAIGKSPGSRSKIVILQNNHLGDARFYIGNKSELHLYNTSIKNLTYQLADSARVTLTGAAQYLINHQNPNQK